ncbi:hypothetical protein BMI90_16040 [Thioclava sp. L04-15]|jgi:hypothetical protein|nr:hypothetical protein BMI90_16040 [Thioclava sp. L04-15]
MVTLLLKLFGQRLNMGARDCQARNLPQRSRIGGKMPQFREAATQSRFCLRNMVRARGCIAQAKSPEI